MHPTVHPSAPGALVHSFVWAPSGRGVVPPECAVGGCQGWPMRTSCGRDPGLGRAVVWEGALKKQEGEVGAPESRCSGGERGRACRWGEGWRIVLRGAAIKNRLPCCWDPRRISPVQRGGLSRCLISRDPARKACLLAPTSSETIERKLLCLHQSGNGLQDCWFHVPDPTFLPSFTYLSHIPWVPAGCQAHAGCGRNETWSLAHPCLLTAAPFKTGWEASARGPGQPPPKAWPLWLLRGRAWPLTHPRVSATGKPGPAPPPCPGSQAPVASITIKHVSLQAAELDK